MAKATSAQGDKPVVVAEQNTETKGLATGTQGETLQVNTQELTTGTMPLNVAPANIPDVNDGFDEDQTAAAALIMGADDDHPSWLIGAFDVKARAQSGFWRCGIHFLNSNATRVFIVTSKADVPADHQCDVPCCYLTANEAQRVYNEPWLTVLVDSTVIRD